MQRIVWLGGEIRDLDGVPLRDALADHGVAHAHGQTADRAHQIVVHAVGGGDPEVARLFLGDVDGAAAGIGERAGVRQDARKHGLELERGIDRPADLAERLELADRARQLLGPLLDLAFEVGVGFLELPGHEIELLGERLQLVAGLDIDAALKIAPADAGGALLQGARIGPARLRTYRQAKAMSSNRASPPIAIPAMTGRLWIARSRSTAA